MLAIGLNAGVSPGAQDPDSVVLADFEKGLSGFDGQITADTVKPHQGSGCAKMRADLSLVTQNPWLTAQKTLDLKKEIVALRFWARSVGTKQMTVRLVDATGQCLQVRPAIVNDGEWHPVNITTFEGGPGFQAFGGANDKKVHWPAQSLLFILEKNGLEGGRGTLWIDDVVLVPGKNNIVSGPAFTMDKLGHVFTVGEKVELALEASADKAQWTVYDFWHKVVAEGKADISDAAARIETGVVKPGYYLIHIVPEKEGKPLSDDLFTSFAIVQPHKPVDALNGPFGVMTHFAQGMNPSILPLFAKIGITSIRDEHYWSQVEKTKGVYEFPEKSDAYMNACQENGISPLVAMTFGNPMYDHNDGPSTPSGFQGYGNYGQAILKKYGDQIHWLEIWNEYNGSWAPPPARNDSESRFTIYTEMLKVAYQKIKQLRPDVQVLGGAAVIIPIPYFEGMFKLGALDFMDAVVIHPYRAKPEGVDQEVEELQELMRKYNQGKDKPIWVTETGCYAQKEYDWERGRKMYEMGRTEGARYLPRQYTLLLKQNVEKIYWYLACDHATFTSMGLLRHHQREASGMGRLAVAPAYVSYATLIHQLDGARFVERQGWREYTRAYAQLFKHGTEEIRVCWSTQPAKMRFKTMQPLIVVDLVGGETTVAPVNGEVVLDLGEDVVYVKGPVQGVTEVDTGRRVIASASDDFTKTQGGNNWYYGFYTGDGPYHPSDFKELKQVVTIWGYEWSGETKFLKQSPNYMHPDWRNGAALPAVRRWKSPVAAKIRIVTDWRVSEKGDGVRVSILVDGKELSSRVLKSGTEGDIRIETETEVRPGSLVDLVCHPNQNTVFDSTGLEGMIIQK